MEGRRTAAGGAVATERGRGRGRLRLLLDGPAGAQELALGGAQAAGEAVLIEAETLHLYMRVGGVPGRVAARLEEIAAATRSRMAELWKRQAVAARDGDGAGLSAVASDFERVGARIFAAEAAAQASVAHGAAGSADARRRAESHAARLAAACGAGGLTLATTMKTSALTARERETAQLVARSEQRPDRGAPFPVRTDVESHVYRATTKLGLHDRAALGAFLTGERATRA